MLEFAFSNPHTIVTINCLQGYCRLVPVLRDAKPYTHALPAAQIVTGQVEWFIFVPTCWQIICAKQQIVGCEGARRYT